MQIPGQESLFIASLFTALDIIVSVVASGHVLLHKRDTRASIGWIGLIWLSPMLGSVLYVLLGVNRIHRKAKRLSRERPRIETGPPLVCDVGGFENAIGPDHENFKAIARLGDHVSPWPLMPGNDILPLFGGDEAYPAMLRAIDEARETISLGTYIFDRDRVGLLFMDALEKAKARGVEVRVLIDDFGSRHTWRPVIRPLRKAGIAVASYHPTLAPGWLPYLNLRNHRKILVIDGVVGFTGGLNILEDYSWATSPASPKMDVHFQLRGPVVAHLQEVFADDWFVCSGEILEGDPWFPTIPGDGEILARGIVDGPDDDQDHLLRVILGAIACADSTVAVVNPYFLPDSRLISALEVAALRGVQVDILLPSENNHILIQWASMALLRELIESGCRIWFSPPPFDHTKLMVVDSAWSFIGSANLDPRSLRLNFEFNVECYGKDLAIQLDEYIDQRIANASPVTTAFLDRRSLAVKLRDGAARLLSPYL